MESIFRAFGKCHLESLSVFPDETNASCYNACLRRILTMEIKVIGEISREEQEKCIEEIKAKKPYHNFQELLLTNDTWEVK